MHPLLQVERRTGQQVHQMQRPEMWAERSTWAVLRVRLVLAVLRVPLMLPVLRMPLVRAALRVPLMLVVLRVRLMLWARAERRARAGRLTAQARPAPCARLKTPLLRPAPPFPAAMPLSRRRSVQGARRRARPTPMRRPVAPSPAVSGRPEPGSASMRAERTRTIKVPVRETHARGRPPRHRCARARRGTAPSKACSTASSFPAAHGPRISAMASTAPAARAQRPPAKAIPPAPGPPGA